MLSWGIFSLRRWIRFYRTSRGENLMFLVVIFECWVGFFHSRKNWSHLKNKVHFTGNLIVSVTLLMATKKSVTERVDPWLTPFSCWNWGDICPFTLTENVLSNKKLLMKFNIFPLHNMFCSLCNMWGRYVVYAFATSNDTRLRMCPFLNDSYISDCISWRQLNVLLYCRNPCWWEER
jgi:hypothetical protein